MQYLVMNVHTVLQQRIQAVECRPAPVERSTVCESGRLHCCAITKIATQEGKEKVKKQATKLCLPPHEASVHQWFG